MASFQQRTLGRKNVKGLALNASQPKQPVPSAPDSQIPGAIGNNNRDDTLEIGVEFRLDLHNEDLVLLKELGAGNGGTVSKVQHAATKAIMARKIIHVEAKKEVRKRIVQELAIMHECNSPYIVSFYGAFMNPSGDVVMCMEYMDVGSLDSISKNFGPVRIDVLGKIAEHVLGGLTYLYSAHRIMHRDIKPSNILVNSRGNIKLCDFGVSSELVNSVADTFVGTGTYMAPERIQGSAYTVKSDVWSVGLTLMELAIGKFPFASDNEANDEEGGGPQGILDLLQQIVMEDPPKLPRSDAFPHILDDMIAKCLMKAPEQRPTPKELYDSDAFLQAAKRTPVDLQAWAVGMMEKHNRRSHLALNPQPSPSNASNHANSVQLDQRSPSSSGPGSGAMNTPTSNEMSIPIANLSLSDGSNAYQATESGAMDTSSTTPRPFPHRTSSAGLVPQLSQDSGNYAGGGGQRGNPPSGPLPQLPGGSAGRRSNGMAYGDSRRGYPSPNSTSNQGQSGYGFPNDGRYQS